MELNLNNALARVQIVQGTVFIIHI